MKNLANGQETESCVSDNLSTSEAQLASLPTSEWLTAAEAAAYLKVKVRTLLEWTRQGKVKGYILSGTHRVTWRFLVLDLDATMKAPSVAESGGIR